MADPRKDYAAIYLKNYIVDTLSSKKKGAKPMAGAQSITPEDLKASSQLIYLLILNTDILSHRESHLQLSLELILLTSQKSSPELMQ